MNREQTQSEQVMSPVDTVYLKDYQAPDFLIEKTELTFELDPLATRVTSRLHCTQNPERPSANSLFLQGEALTLISVSIDGQVLTASDYEQTDEGLLLKSVPAAFILECVTDISPETNTSLEGLYKSRTMYCTQCEAEGFRKITYYLDRPDVLSEFTTTVIGDKAQFPILLSNGNLIDKGEKDNGLHYATWHDPFKKPAYLFALVAGDLEVVEDTFTTCNDRKVDLKIFVEEKDLDKCDHAMQSLKHSMRWDEEVYGREYDLDIFMIVAVDDFNMGAMENKGLNIFNTSCVLASPKTTTDAGFARVEGVVAHEYFHNWSGNRVTCRDWFQLSLKEGFTVFRDEEFSADMGSRTVKRVEDVNIMRTLQFAEDAGPMAHPVRPPSYMEISNFYTLTVYEKGAEVVRMYHTLLGAKAFREATDLYFDRHDGQAATIEHFIDAMQTVSGRDFSQFKRWYTQAGTPVVKASGEYDAASKRYTLTLEQYCPDTPEAKSADKRPFHIPVDMSLLGEQGALPLVLKDDSAQDLSLPEQTHRVLELTQARQQFVFANIPAEPVPVLFRSFSAPVKSAFPYKKVDLLKIIKQESDGFARYDAISQLSVIAIFDVMAALRKDEIWTLEPTLLDAFQSLLSDKALDPAMVALMCQLPSLNYLSGLSAPIEVDLLHRAREALFIAIAEECADLWLATYHRCATQEPYQFNAEAVALRSLKNVALSYLMKGDAENALPLCLAQYEQADNMTDQAAALTVLVHSDSPALQSAQSKALNDFYQQWQHESLVVNVWLSIQASNPSHHGLKRVMSLIDHPAYDASNPNKIRSVVGVFCSQNLTHFHASDGSGYLFLTNQVLALNETNPQIASRLLAPLTKWRKYDVEQQSLMKAALEKIQAAPNLSKDVYEVVSKSLS